MVQDKLKKSFSILGMGTVVVDHQVVVRELPKPDAKAESYLTDFKSAARFRPPLRCSLGLEPRHRLSASGQRIGGVR